MRNKISKIPDKVLKGIFPKKIDRSVAPERVYKTLKKMILSGKLEKGKRLVLEEIAEKFSISRMAVAKAISQLKKEGLVITNKRNRSSVV